MPYAWLAAPAGSRTGAGCRPRPCPTRRTVSADSSPKAIATKVIFRGKNTLRIWNPHTAAQEAAELPHGGPGGQAVTPVRLLLPPVSPRFFLQD